LYTIKPQLITQLLREITLRFASDEYRINGRFVEICGQMDLELW